MVEADYYKILGLESSCSQTEIKDAYKKLAKTYHPDKNRNLSEKEKDEFKKKYMSIHKAYEVLSDEKTRKEYDKSGISIEKGATIVDPLQAMMRMVEEKNTTGVPDVIVPISSNIRQLYYGFSTSIEFTRISACGKCKATGTKNRKLSNCPSCDGRGITLTCIDGGDIGFTYKESTCDVCRGSGIDPSVKRCSKCSGDKYIREDVECDITIPKGAYEGYFTKIESEGNFIPKENRIDPKQIRSDVICVIDDVDYNVLHNSKDSDNTEDLDNSDNSNDMNDIIIKPIYRRGIVIKELQRADRADLIINLEVPFEESICGISKKIRHLDDSIIELKVDDSVVNGDIIIIEKKGMPILVDEISNRKAKGLDTEFGDLLVKFEIKRPVLDNSIKRKIWQILTNTSYQKRVDLDNCVKYYLLEDYISNFIGKDSNSDSDSDSSS